MSRMCGSESWVGCRYVQVSVCAGVGTCRCRYVQVSVCAGVAGVNALYRLPGYVGVPLLVGWCIKTSVG